MGPALRLAFGWLHPLAPCGATRQKQRVADLFEHRYLFVRHQRSQAQRQQLRRLTRGLSPLRRLREIIDEVYRLFDRRCKPQTALKKLAKLRRRCGVSRR